VLDLLLPVLPTRGLISGESLLSGARGTAPTIRDPLVVSVRWCDSAQILYLLAVLQFHPCTLLRDVSVLAGPDSQIAGLKIPQIPKV
jgi:hypothetical protein